MNILDQSLKFLNDKSSNYFSGIGTQFIVFLGIILKWFISKFKKDKEKIGFKKTLINSFLSKKFISIQILLLILFIYKNFNIYILCIDSMLISLNMSYVFIYKRKKVEIEGLKEQLVNNKKTIDEYNVIIDTSEYEPDDRLFEETSKSVLDDKIMKNTLYKNFNYIITEFVDNLAEFKFISEPKIQNLLQGLLYTSATFLANNEYKMTSSVNVYIYKNNIIEEYASSKNGFSKQNQQNSILKYSFENPKILADDGYNYVKDDSDKFFKEIASYDEKKYNFIHYYPININNNVLGILGFLSTDENYINIQNEDFIPIIIKQISFYMANENI